MGWATIEAAKVVRESGVICDQHNEYDSLSQYHLQIYVICTRSLKYEVVWRRNRVQL